MLTHFCTLLKSCGRLASPCDKLITRVFEKVLHLHFSYFLALQLFLKSETFLANVFSTRLDISK